VIKVISSLTMLFLLFGVSVSYGAVKMVTLQSALEYAYSHSKLLMAERKKLLASEMQIKEAKALYSPSVTFSSSYVRLKEGKTLELYYPTGIVKVPMAFENTYQHKLTLQYLFYGGGKRKALVQQAKDNYKVVKEEYEHLRNQVAFNVKKAYFSVLKASSYVDLTTSIVKQLNAHLYQVRHLYKAGIAPLNDVLRVEVEIANVTLEKIKAKHQLMLAYLALKNVMGMDLHAPVKVIEELKYTSIHQGVDYYVKEALGRRYELSSIKLQLDMLEAAKRIAGSDTKPTIVLSADYYRKGDKFWPDSDEWDIALVASWKLFDGGKTDAAVSGKEYSIEQLRLTMEQLKDNIALEVNSAYVNLLDAEERIATIEKQLEKARDDLRIATQRYKAQVGTNIDVLDAETSLKQTRTNYIQALYDANMAVARLKFVTERR